MNLPFFIAKRYLISKKSHNAINIISGISVAGIAIGTMALIVILSVFNGLADLVKSMYNTINPDIVITVAKGKVFNSDAPEFKALQKLESIAFYNESIEGKALIKYQDKQAIVTIKGVGNQYLQMTDFSKLIKEGEYNIDKKNILISRGTQYTLNYALGNLFTPLSIYAPKRGKVSTLDDGSGLNEIKSNAWGVFSVNDEFDQHAIMNIAAARELLDYTNEISSIELYLKSGTDLNVTQHEIKTLLGEKYSVKNRDEQNAVLYKTMKTEKLWTFIILAFILTVATFNMIASLTMLIIEKKKDVHVLRYLGANATLIRNIFLIEGILITAVGAIAGLVLGLILCWLQENYSLIKLSDGFVINAYPVKTEVKDVLIVVITVLSIGLFATWYPVKVLVKKLTV
jgi:lipoprotein-releasing system permease protein